MKQITRKKKTVANNLKTEFPKYTASLMNLSNSIGNLTSKRNIGPLFEYFQEFKDKTKSNNRLSFNVKEWSYFYLEEKNGKQLIKKAVQKNLENIEKLKNALKIIDEELIENYIEDLIFKKTFIGMDVEYLVVSMFAKKFNLSHKEIKKSNSKEESQGIDMWISNIPIQIKPYSSYIARSREILKKGIVVYYSNNLEKEITIYYDENRSKEIIKGAKSENNS